MTATKNIVLDWVWFSINTIVIAARLYVRRRQKKRINISDFLIIVALAFNLCCITLFQVAVRNPVIFENIGVSSQSNLHNDDPEAKKLQALAISILVNYLKLGYASGVFVIMCLYAVKASVLAFYFDVFPYMTRNVKWTLWITAIFNVVAFLVGFIFYLAWCEPMSLNWSVTEHACSPTNYTIPFTFTSWFNIVSDVAVLCVPISVLRSMTLPRRESTALVFVFAVGIMSVIAGLVKFGYIMALNDGKLTTDTSSGLLIALWSDIEMGTAMLAACLPSLRVLLRVGSSSEKPDSGTVGSTSTAGQTFLWKRSRARRDRTHDSGESETKMEPAVNQVSSYDFVTVPNQV